MSSRHAPRRRPQNLAALAAALALVTGCAGASEDAAGDETPTAEQAEALAFRRLKFDAPIQFIENRIGDRIEDSLIATTTGRYTVNLTEHAGRGFVTVRPPSWLVPTTAPILLEGRSRSSAWTDDDDMLVVSPTGDSMEASVPVRLDALAPAGIDISTCEQEGFAAAVIRFSNHSSPREFLGDGYGFDFVPTGSRVVGRPNVSEKDLPIFDELFVKNASIGAKGSSAVHLVFSVAAVCDTPEARRQIEARIDFALPTNEKGSRRR